MRMDDTRQAQAWVDDEIARLRGLGFDDLLALAAQKPEHRPVQTPDGRMLALESQVIWDDPKKKNLRVLVDVWDPSSRGLSTSIARSDFIRSPDGFVGE
jgi:hypothetical protein